MPESEILRGLQFACANGLTIKEMEALIPFFKANYSHHSLAKFLKVNPSTLHHVVQNLKLKGLIKTIEKEKNRTIIYGLNIYLG